MSVFDKLKTFAQQISDIEYTLSNNKQAYHEMCERYSLLEKEISQRTKELNQANKTLLTLQHIWEMMNSSQPLSVIFEKIMSALQGDLDYLTSIIIQKRHADSEEFFQTRAYIENDALSDFTSTLKQPLSHYKLKYVEDSVIVKAMKEYKTLHTNDVKGLFKLMFPELSEKVLEYLDLYLSTKSIIVLPLTSNTQPYGALLVFSPREECFNNELNFLNLFAHQMELAITITNLFEEVKKQAVTDSLTDLYNRRYFEEALLKEFERSNRIIQPFSIISLDLDDLKKINDTYGHAFGDVAIKTVADVLKKNARSIDTPSRLGGEEFCILLPGVDSENALIVAERIRSSIEAEELTTIGQITASIGVATFPEHCKNVDELIELADQAMYKSKMNGKNQVQPAKSKDDTSWQEAAIEAFIQILSKRKIPVSKDLAKNICSQLKKPSVSESSVKDLLYHTVDTISQSYNELHQNGLTRMKFSLANKLAKKLELPKEEIDRLKIAMLLYDIGNSLLPENIFKKKGPLTENEKKKIHSHPIIAAREILQPISIISDVIPIIEHHHENWDGSGYPNEIAGQEIPILSQIILLTDSYTALTQNRPYRVALSTEEALEIIKQDTDKKWSSTLVELFVEIIEKEQNNN